MTDATDARDGKAVSPERILVAYELLLTRSLRMLASARAQDWDALVDEQTRYVMEVEWLARHEQGVALPLDAVERKAVLLARMLENEGEVRACLTARRDELGQLLGTSMRQRELGRAYRPRRPLPVDIHPLFDPDKP